MCVVVAGERRQIREISANIGDIKRFVSVLKWGLFSPSFSSTPPRFSFHNSCFKSLLCNPVLLCAGHGGRGWWLLCTSTIRYKVGKVEVLLLLLMLLLLLLLRQTASGKSRLLSELQSVTYRFSPLAWASCAISTQGCSGLSWLNVSLVLT